MTKEKKVIMRRFRRRGDFLSSSPLSNEMQLSHFRCFLRRQCKLLHSKTTPESLRLLPISIDTQYTCVPGSPLTAKVKVKATVRLLQRAKLIIWLTLWQKKKKKINDNNARFRRRREFLSSSHLSNEKRLSHFRCFLRRQCKLLHSKTTLQSIRLLPSRSCQGSKFEDTHSHALRKVT